MHIVFSKKMLVTAIKSSIRFTSDLASNAALGGIRFTASAEGVFLESSNQLASVRVVVGGCTVKKEGSVLLKGSLLNSVLPKIKGEEIDFNRFEENKVAITSGSYMLELNALDGSTFPELSFDTASWDEYVLSAETLVSIATRIAPAASTDDSKMVQLTGINMVLAEGKMRASATDSFKFLSNVYPLAGNDFNLILRKMTLDFIKDTLLERKIKEFKLYVKNRSILFAADDLFFKSETIDNKYPQIERVLSIEKKVDLVVDRIALLDMLDRGTAIGNSKTQVLNLELDRDALIFNFRNAGAASSSEKMTVANPLGATDKVSLNAAYFITVAQALAAPSIHVCLNGKDRPVKLYNDDEPDFVGVIVNLVSQ